MSEQRTHYNTGAMLRNIHTGEEIQITKRDITDTGYTGYICNKVGGGTTWQGVNTLNNHWEVTADPHYVDMQNMRLKLINMIHDLTDKELQDIEFGQHPLAWRKQGHHYHEFVNTIFQGEEE